MIIRRTNEKSKNGNQIVLVKSSEKGTFQPYEAMIDQETGEETYVSYDDLDRICSLNSGKLRFDLIVVSSKIHDNLAVSKHFVAYRSSETVPFSTKTVVTFWRKQSDKWNGTKFVDYSPEAMAIVNKVANADISKQVEDIRSKLQAYMKETFQV